MALEAEDGMAIRGRSGTRGACLITLEKAQQDLPILIGRALAGEEIVTAGSCPRAARGATG